jgi:cell division protein FtsQ
MNAKRRVSAVKVLRFLLTVAGVAGCLVAVTSAARRQEKEKIRGVNLVITNAKQVQFISPESLRQMLFKRRHLNPEEIPLGAADINRFERIARSNPWIEDAEVYVDNRRVLQVRATQRVPVVRLFETTGASYYLDTALQQLPLSLDYTHYTPVVTGVPPLKSDSTASQMKGKIVSLIKIIDADSFWKHGVEEIAINPAGEFEIIPVLGTHRLLLGDTSKMAEKLHNVFLFYKAVMSKVGWDRYTVLDVRYDGQVVASPALPWKAPVDRALSNMNWVKTIVKEDAIPLTTGGGATSASASATAAPVIPVAAPKTATTTAAAPQKMPAQRAKTAQTGTASKAPVVSKKTTVSPQAAKPASKAPVTQKSFPQKPVSTGQKPKGAPESASDVPPSQNPKKESPKAVLPGATVQP